MRLLPPLLLGAVAAALISAPARAEKPRPASPSKAGSAPATAPDDAHHAEPAPNSSDAAPGGGAAPGSVPSDSTRASEGVTPEPGSPGSAPERGPAPGETTAPAGQPAPSPGTPAVPGPPTQPGARRVLPSKLVLDEDEDENVPAARDTVGGHFAVAVDVGVVLPFGSVASGIPQSRTMGAGLSLGGDVAYGVSRTVMLGAYIDVGLPEGRGVAANSGVSTVAAGPFVRYHLVQGMRFDPWVSGGLGFRRTGDGNVSYTGVDWVRFALGGDWYPASNVGFGPILELSLGTFFGQSPGSLPSASLNAYFVAGLRVVFDGPGK